MDNTANSVTRVHLHLLQKALKPSEVDEAHISEPLPARVHTSQGKGLKGLDQHYQGLPW